MWDRLRAKRVLVCVVGVGIVAVAVAGSSLGAADPQTPIPVVSKVRLTPKSFKAALVPTPGYGAIVHYRLSVNNAVQTFVVKKLIGTKWVVQKGTFKKRGRQGKDVFPFPGIYHGKRLKKGSYEMVVTPALAGVGVGKPVTAHFTVIG
jgi:hypothetical protein